MVKLLNLVFSKVSLFFFEEYFLLTLLPDLWLDLLKGWHFDLIVCADDIVNFSLLFENHSHETEPK